MGRTAPNVSNATPAAVHLTAEYWPWARTGGLAEAVTGLAEAQAAGGTPVTVLLPLYRLAWDAQPDLEPVGPAFPVRVGDREEQARLFGLPGLRPGPRVLFIAHPQYFDRAGIYGEGGADYADNARRFAFFCAAALRLVPDLVPAGPVVLHAHDWHAALAPVYLRTVLAGRAGYDRVASVLSVHNAGFQGRFPPDALDAMGLDRALHDWRWMEWYGEVNVLKGGLRFTDLATTVSPTHAAELRTPEGGFGLHEVFLDLGDRFGGILNGIDLSRWNPAADPHLATPYSVDDRTGKLRCKAELQAAYGLPQGDRAPIVALIARLASQKGLDLVLGGLLDRLPDARFIFLGRGEERYERALEEWAARAPGRIAVAREFSDHLEHRMLAGADLLLMPSLYEPCGLTQMRAQIYGTLPVARRVGGLADTIEDGVTGFLFDAYDPAALEAALRRALAQFDDPERWAAMMDAAMRRDFGWARSVREYDAIYRRALVARGVPPSPGAAGARRPRAAHRRGGGKQRLR